MAARRLRSRRGRRSTGRRRRERKRRNEDRTIAASESGRRRRPIAREETTWLRANATTRSARDDRPRLRGAVVGGVAVGAQHPVGALVGALSDMPAGGARAGHPHRVVQTALGDLVREHLLGHRRPTDISGADEGDVQPRVSRAIVLRHLTSSAARRPSRRATHRRSWHVASAKSASPYPQPTTTASTPVGGRAFDVVASVPTMSTRSGSGCNCASACASTSALLARVPSTLAPATTSKCLSRPKWARMESRVGSALEVATASRTPAARKSASSGPIPSNRLLIAQPRDV